MNERDGSLHAQHEQIDRMILEVVEAGRRRRWPEYRSLFGALREGITQHMAFEEEVLFPFLEPQAPAPVGALREQHAQLRRQLEMLGAAAPELDPDGCIAELHELAALLIRHHAAEVALDPQYASRPTPPLLMDEAPPIDLRGLQPPEPIVRIFHELERNPGTPLRVILPHEPLPLYGLLQERGYAYSGAARADGGFEVLIERA